MVIGFIKREFILTIVVKQTDLFHTHPIQLEEPLEKDMNNEQVKNAQVILKDSAMNQVERTDISVKARK